MISRSITQVFTWKSESVRVKRGCKFWPWRPFCARFCFKRTVRYTVLCIWEWRDTVWWYWNITKRSLEKAALVWEKFPNFCDKTKLPTQYIFYFSRQVDYFRCSLSGSVNYNRPNIHPPIQWHVCGQNLLHTETSAHSLAECLFTFWVLWRSETGKAEKTQALPCLLYTSPSPRD